MQTVEILFNGCCTHFKIVNRVLYSTFTIFTQPTLPVAVHFGRILGEVKASSRTLALFSFPEGVTGKEVTKKSPPRSCFPSGSASERNKQFTYISRIN